MFDFLKTLDRRWIFLAMLLAVSLPILAQKTFPEQPTLHVRNVFQKIEDLPEGSTIMISFDYDPGTTGELGPMTTALLRHCCLKRHKMLFLTLFETGSPVIDQAIKEVIEDEFAELELKSGEDYVNLGFKPGREVIIAVIGLNLRQAFPSDHSRTNLDDLPLTKNIVNLQDLDLILDLSAGYPGWKEWVQYAASPYGIPFAAGVTAVGAPQAYPYIPGQMLGILAAVKGAAEYEAALGEKYPKYRDPKLNEGIRRMAPQFWGHLLVIGLIVLGNCIHFADRWRGTP
ncbi:MAG: hypothetical protein EXS05_05935 [Planctomycetaceae bacterium]|nr:hypothetical protein [Planctomycetaceae bacterium]